MMFKAVFSRLFQFYRGGQYNYQCFPGVPFTRHCYDSRTRSVFFPRIDDSHCDNIHSRLNAVHCFDNGSVGKQPVACKEYCLECWLKKKANVNLWSYISTAINNALPKVHDVVFVFLTKGII